MPLKILHTPTLRWVLGLSFLTTVAGAQASPEGFWLLGSFYGNYQRVGVSTTQEPNKSGLGLGLGAVASYYTNQWVLDGELGWMYARLSGTLGTQSFIIHNKNAYAQLNPRYRMGKNFQIGPSVDFLFGTQFDHQLYLVNEPSLITMGGVHLSFDLPSDDNLLVRLGLRAVIDLANRQAFLIGMNLQIGWDWFRAAPKREQVEETQDDTNDEINEVTDEAPLAEEKPAPPPEEMKVAPMPPPPPPPPPAQFSQVIAPQRVRVRFPSDKLLFDFKMSHLRAPIKHYLQNFGEFLTQNRTQWNRVQIVGHTDARGKAAVNQELSEARAQSVYSALAEAGVPTEAMTAKGVGSRQPIVMGKNAKAWGKNRRVDLIFDGVSDPQLFSERINALGNPGR